MSVSIPDPANFELRIVNQVLSNEGKAPFRFMVNEGSMFLFHDNACAHIANATNHSLDMAPSDVHIFTPQKLFVGGQVFLTDEDYVAIKQWSKKMAEDFRQTCEIASRWPRKLH